MAKNLFFSSRQFRLPIYKWNSTFLLLILFCIGLIARLYGLDSESFFMDEIRQARFYSVPLNETFSYSIKQQQPPLDYWIGHIFYQFDQSDFTLRLPSALFGSLSVLLVTLLLTKYLNNTSVFFIILLFVFSPYHVYFSQEARPYSIAIFFFIGFIYLIDHIRNKRYPNIFDYILLCLCTILFLNTRALAPLMVVIVTGMYFLFQIMIKSHAESIKKTLLKDKNFLIGCTLVLAGLIYTPFFFKIVEHGSRYAQGGSPINTQFFIEGFKNFDFYPIWKAFIVQTEPFGYLLAILLPIALLISYRTGRKHQKTINFCLFLLIGTLLLHSFVFHAKTTFPFRPPYAIYLQPLVLIILALSLGQIIQQQIKKRFFLKIIVLIYALTLYLTLASFHAVLETKTKTDWRGLSQYINKHYQQKDLVLFKSLDKVEKWDPSYYGLYRYPFEEGKISWLTINKFEERISELKSIPFNPSIIFFQYRNFFLTKNSSYPIFPTLTNKPALDIATLLTSDKLTIKSFTGLTLVKLKTPSGNLLTDNLILFNEILKKLPQEPAYLDMYRVFLMNLALCGEKDYQLIVTILEKRLGQSILSEPFKTHLAKTYHRAKENNFSCISPR